MAILITFNIGSITQINSVVRTEGVLKFPPGKVYVAADYIFTEGNGIGESIYMFDDLKNMKAYRLSNGRLQTYDLPFHEAGKRRGWSVVEKKFVSRAVIKKATYLGYECVVIEEVHTWPDPFKPSGPPYSSSAFFYHCKIPELEALPLQTKLHLFMHKEWKNEEYPFELKQWSEYIYEATPKGDPYEEVI